MLTERGKQKINDLLNAVDGLFDDETLEPDMSPYQMKLYVRDKFLRGASSQYADWWIKNQ